MRTDDFVVRIFAWSGVLIVGTLAIAIVWMAVSG